MKLVTFMADGKERLGGCIGNNVFDLNACYLLYLTGATPGKMRQIRSEDLRKMEEKADREMPARMMDFLRLGDQATQRAKKILHRMSELSAADLPKSIVYKLSDISLESPVPKPGKILCLAGNYAEHIREGGREVESKERMSPRVFTKPNTAVIGSEQHIFIPKKGNKIDWEAELAVVIGKEGKYITPDRAYDYVAGYTIMNDVSERELLIDKKREPSEWNRFFDWLNGKWMDTFAPVGPYLVTKEEIKDPHKLRITLKVNGETKQDSNTGNMIFQIPELMEFISRLMILEPGDIIATGTPAGTGAASGQFLKKGDVVEVEIEGIGVLRNAVDVERG